ncbi:MAG TPA: DinB family protein [Gemmatimonadales bacterium]|nr:DinB family protein [Gemmatimonadales bacterium]
MSRAAIATEADLWRMQARMSRDVVYANVHGLTHEDSLVQPRPGGNCLNYVLGHLLSVYDGLLRMLEQGPVMSGEALQRYARGTPPIESPAEALDFGTLLQAWGDASERVDAALAGLDPEILDRRVPESPSGNPDETLRSLLTTVMFHQAYHAGQTAVLRRIAGKEGAIR